MNADIRERREKTFELLIVAGYPYSQVVERISREFDITKSGVKSDISRMENWLPELVDDGAARKDGLVRLKELRKNRQRLQRMAREASSRDDLDTELRIREKIDDNLDLDVALSQSLGLTEREAGELEVDHTFEVRSNIVEVDVVEDDEITGDQEGEDVQPLDGGSATIEIEDVGEDVP